MYSKLSYFLAVPLIATSLAGTGAAQTATPATPSQAPAASAAATAGQATIRGRIADPTGALIPGASITVSNGKGQTVATGTADASGGYELHGVAPGTYSVTATFQGLDRKSVV